MNIVTAHGLEVDMHAPKASTIVLADIAHHLATINRFNGAARRPYSVAEHSLLVCEIAERELHLPPAGQFAALMYNAHAAYTSDLHSPAKAEIGAPWSEFEFKFERLVRGCFHLTAPAVTWAVAIESARLMALATERAQLLPPAPTPWPKLHNVNPISWIDLMERGRCSFTWQDWRRAFADRADELDFARSHSERWLQTR